MSQLAIGMIETVGLAAGIEAADVCLKSANVTLIGYELTKGNGMTVVKIEGNVGAVKAAIEAATVAANKVSKVFSTKVIPRPSEGIDFLMRNCDTVGYESEKAVEELVEIYEDSDEDKNKENIEEDKDNTQEKIEVEVSEEISEHQINIEELEIEEDDSKLEETDNIEGNNQELSQIDNSEDESKDGHNLMHDIIDKFKKKHFLFGLNITVDYIINSDLAIIVESEKAVMKLYQMGFKNAVAVGSHSISDIQALLLSSYCSKVIVAFDEELTEGEIIHACSNLKEHFTEIYYIYDEDKIYLPKGSKMSPADLNINDFKSIMRECRKRLI